MKNIIRLTLILIFIFLAFSCSKAPTDPVSIDGFYNYPNPFKAVSESTTFKVQMNLAEIDFGEIEIYSQDGNFLAKLNVDISSGKANWHGTDKNGKVLPASIYNAVVIVKNKSGNVITATTKTIIR